MDESPFSHPSEWRPAGANVKIGPVQIPAELVTELVIHVEREGVAWRRFATLQLDASSRLMPIWDNRDRLTVTVDGEAVFGGFIQASGFDESSEQWVLFVPDGLERLKQTRFKALKWSGIPPREVTHFMVRRAGWADHEISGLLDDRRLRAFWFSIPLRNVGWPRESPSPVGCHFVDMVLQCYDDVSQGLFAKIASPDGRPLVDVHPEWQESTPKLSGVVLAVNFYEAWLAALGRARVGLDFLLTASHLTTSGYGMGDDLVQLGWLPEVQSSRPRLSTAIYLRDVSRHDRAPVPRFMVFDSDAVDGDFQLDLNQADSHIAALWQVFHNVVQHGRHVLSKDGTLEQRTDRRLSAYQRSLRWLSDGRMQELPEDAFLSFWFGLEALLASHTYENLFEGPNEQIRAQLERAIDNMVLPNEATIDKQFLKNRLLRADPTPRQKLITFASSVGCELEPSDLALALRLGNQRSKQVHGSSGVATPDELRRLEHLLERLLIAAVVESSQRH